jgi:translation initiation factor 2 alpha subunit (eIF-2alpha)
MEYEVGDVLLCTVEKIVGTTVFVNIENSEKQGSINFSEVAPGRIRNIRDYVVPRKTIVCKILKISGNNLELSLRRVTQKEEKEVREKYKQERNYKSVLKSILKEKTEEIIKELCEGENVCDVLEKAKENPKKLEKVVGKIDSKKILEILKAQKQKKAIVKKIVSFNSSDENGIGLIKKILENIEETEIKYLSAGKYIIKIEENEVKKADNKAKKIIEDLEKACKKEGIELSHKSQKPST